MENDTCRVCFQKNSGSVSLFLKHGKKISPQEYLLNYTKIKINENDGGPTSICRLCLKELEITVNFLEKCEIANHLLSSYKLDNVLPGIPNVEAKDLETTDMCSLIQDLEVEMNIPEIEICQNVPESNAKHESNFLLNLFECDKCGSRRRCSHWSPPTKFTCAQCNKVFNRKSNYVLHLKRHSGVREWPCASCGRGQLTAALARAHCRQRTRRPCPRVGCTKSFTTITNLRTHLNMHDGERPYQCAVCGKNFACKNTLNDHKRIHTGEKPYMCSICGASFTTNKLSAHRRLHMPSRAAPRPRRPRAAPARCPACPARYRHTQSLRRHQRKHHEKPTTTEDLLQETSLQNGDG